MLPPREEITWSRKLKKKSRERASKGMRHESAAQVCTTHIWRSPRKLRKNDSQEKCFCQSYNCAVAKVWRIVCESNCIDEPAGENCHTEVYRGSKTACVAQVFLHLARFHHVQPLGGMICATWRRFLQCARFHFKGHGRPKKEAGCVVF